MATEPTASRPGFPGYGIHSDVDGMLPWSWAAERLERSRNYWIATASPDGRPHAMPVWGVWADGAVVFSTSRTSRKGRNLAANPAVVVHLESGDDVVVLEGEVEEVERDGVTGARDAYEAKYAMTLDEAPGEGVWYALRPRRAFAWRERDYPHSATRFSF